MLKRRYGWAVFLAIISTVLIVGCSKKDLSKNRVGKLAVPVEVTRVAPADIIEAVEVVGSLSAKYQADVRAEFAGVVSDVYISEWIRVKKGTPLARQDTQELDLALRRIEAALEGAKATVLQAEVAKNRSEREYDRALKMKEAGLVTQQNMDDIASEKDAANARLSAARAGLSASEHELKQAHAHISKGLIRSPMDGVVSMRNVNPGDLVGDMGGTKVIFRVVDNRLLDLTMAAPSKNMAAIHVGQPVTFSTDAVPGKIFSGKITFINPAVSEVDRAVKIIAEVKNESEELKAGLFVKGRIITDTRKAVLQVQRSGLLSWDLIKKQADVFVVKGDKVRKQAIATGTVSTDLAEVISGLAAGDQVVTRGGFNLKDGDTVKVIRDSGR